MYHYIYFICLRVAHLFSFINIIIRWKNARRAFKMQSHKTLSLYIAFISVRLLPDAGEHLAFMLFGVFIFQAVRAFRMCPLHF